METVALKTSQQVDIDYPVAGLGERISARLIDLAVLAGMVIFLAILSVTIGSVFFYIIASVIYAFYPLACEILMNGQSIGKRTMQIKVISIDGSQPSLGQYFIRWIFRIIDFALTAQIGGLLCIALTDNKQRIGDIVAGTTLIKTVPRTQFNHIAFHPAEADYAPVFTVTDRLSDHDVELIHEVITTYNQTGNTYIVYTAAARIMTLLDLKLPAGMNELDFLKTIVKDYSELTSYTSATGL